MPQEAVRKSNGAGTPHSEVREPTQPPAFHELRKVTGTGKPIIPPLRIVRVRSREKRHGIVSRIIMRPHFRPATAPVAWDKDVLRWPGPLGSGFLSPQPPGIVGIGPIAVSVTGPTQVGPFFFWASASGPAATDEAFRASPVRVPARNDAQPDISVNDTVILRSVLGQGAVDGPRHRRERCALKSAGMTNRGLRRISATTYRPRPASGLACRGCRPGRRRPPRRCRRGRFSPAERTSFPTRHSSRRP